MTDTIDDFIRKSKLRHGEKYDYSKSEYYKSNTPIVIICPTHGEFLQKPVAHLHSGGCQQCAGNVKISTEEFIRRSKEIHNNFYNYSITDINDKIDGKVKIICPTHGIFMQRYLDHTKGRGCDRCGGTSKKTTVEFIKEANKVHNNFYDYSKTEYISIEAKVIIICPTHGEFLQPAVGHLSGQGCTYCGRERQGRQKTHDTFVAECKRVHDNFYDYSKTEYTLAHNAILISCPIHGEFLQKAYTHLSGHGCSRCSNGANSTKAENQWLDFMLVPKTLKNRQCILYIDKKRIKVDGYISETNTIYEFWGDFWHGNPETTKKNDVNPKNKKTFGKLFEETQIKRNLILDAGYNLVEIWESDWRQIKMINNKLLRE